MDTRLLENFYKSKGYYKVKILATNVLYEEEEGFLFLYKFFFEILFFAISKRVLNVSLGI